MTNLLHHPFAGLLFLIPGWSACFRLNGRAQISVDPALCARFAQNGVPAKSVVVIRVDEAFIHCGRAIGFAGLWESGRQHDPALRWRCSRRMLPCIRRRNSESALSARRRKQTRQTASVAITHP